jgi:serine/threonine protein kinase
MSSPQDSVPDPHKKTVLQPTDATVPLGTTPSQDTSVALNLGTAQKIAGDRYRLERLAGSGGMGFVFVAHDERLDRKVAIKFLKDVETSSLRDRLLKEARAMAGLRHPGICPVYEVNIDSTRPFLVMGWIDGLELDQAWWNMEAPQRLELFERIVDATAALHDAGLVHLDIKPMNILVDRTGSPVIVDFGLARTSTHGSTGSSGGTPGFAAPEQFDSNTHASPACDVYALGMLLYFGLTDRLPWSESDPRAIIERARSEEAPPPGEFIPDIPWPLQRITLAAIERNASHRYPDAKSLLRDIQRYRRGESVSAKPSSLLNNFQLQVQQRRDETEAWHARGMITRDEADHLARVYDRVQQPYSHWILDSRRLSISQVTLYCGAWMVLLAFTIGIGFSWEALGDAPWLRYGIPLFFTGALTLIGVKLIHSDHKRMALGYLFTACLAVPISIGIFLVEQDWLNDASHGQLFTITLNLPPILSNLQLLACSATLIAVSILAHRRIPSSAFSPMIVIGTILLCMSSWAALDMVKQSGGSLALLGAWSLFLGIAYLAIGIRASLREQREQVLLTPGTGRVHIAWAMLTGGSILILLGLTLLAWNRPWLYMPGLLPAPDVEALQYSFPRVDARSRAAAFMINGLLLLGLSTILSRIGTNPCRRLAELIRWLIPAHILGGMLALEQETWEARNAAKAPIGCWIWLGVSAVTSAAFAFSSVLRQWRPFLVSGLIGIAAVYWTLYERLERSLEPATFEWTAIGLVAAACIGGILIMMASGRLTSRNADPA